jgi:pimeloyl-ACP methyl ester carboxylesterase
VDLSKDIPVTALYGADSWVSPINQENFEAMRPGLYTKICLVQGAGHHVYAQAEEFNYQVLNACKVSDANVQKN